MLAWAPGKPFVLMVTVNSVGRGAWAPGVSGLGYTEMAAVARRFGATEAVLLDGGGSTAMAQRVGARTVRADASARARQRGVPDVLVLR
jgi:exopolysaccharide biosynthesis protein